MKKTNCPNCGHEMKQVEIRSHYGLKIVVDQCDNCGGLWFDDEESLRADLKEYKKLEAFDSDKLMKKVSIQSSLNCPRDNTPLKIFHDSNFPKNIKVHYCPQCFGFRFNRGEFSNYQQAREKKIEEKKVVHKNDAEFEKQVSSLLRLDSSSGKYDSLGEIGKFLSTPVKRGGFNMPYGGGSRGSEYSQMAYGAYLVISSLLRMLLAKKK